MIEPEMRRRPTLADRFISKKFMDWERAVHPRAIDQLQRSTRKARRFVFDENATRRSAHVIDTVPDLLAREHQFARAPYDLTWIEFPSHVLWEYMRERNREVYTGLGKYGEKATADHTIGYLIDHERVNIICGGTCEEPDLSPNIMPLQYRLHTPWEKPDRDEFRRLTALPDEMNPNAFLWGSTFTKLDAATRAELENRNTVELLPLNPRHKMFDRYQGNGEWHEAMRGSVGELRKIIALLLILNRPSLARYERTTDNARGFWKGKSIAYLSHTVVGVDLDAVPTLLLIGTPEGEGVPRRRHEVRGHFKHDETAREYASVAGCIHEFQASHGPHKDWALWLDAPPGIPGDPGVPRNWVCAACGGRRWWQKESHRGSAEVGFVVKDGYDVEADE